MGINVTYITLSLIGWDSFEVTCYNRQILRPESNLYTIGSGSILLLYQSQWHIKTDSHNYDTENQHLNQSAYLDANPDDALL